MTDHFFYRRNKLPTYLLLLRYVYSITMYYSVRHLHTQKMLKRISFCFLFLQSTYTTHNFLGETFVPNLKHLATLCRPFSSLNCQNSLSETNISLRISSPHAEMTVLNFSHIGTQITWCYLRWSMGQKCNANMSRSCSKSPIGGI